MTEAYKKRLIEKTKEIQAMLDSGLLDVNLLKEKLYLLIGFIMALDEGEKK